ITSRTQSSTLFPYTTLFRSNLERGRLLARGNHGRHGLEVRPIKIGAESEVQSQGDDQSEPEPTAFPAAREQTLGRHAVEIVKVRSEEHTSELQSRGHLVCRL